MHILWIECISLFVLVRLRIISHVQDSHVLPVKQNAKFVLSCFNHCVQHWKVHPQVEIFAVYLLDAEYIQIVYTVSTEFGSTVLKDAQAIVMSVDRECLSVLCRRE